MSFNHHDIRRSMDVFTLDSIYLGVVLKINTGPESADEVRLRPEAARFSDVNGEMLGPMPTAPLGDTGPAKQSAEAGYAVNVAGDQPRQTGQGSLVVGKWRETARTTDDPGRGHPDRFA